jgi:hypothetical protein
MLPSAQEVRAQEIQAQEIRTVEHTKIAKVRVSATNYAFLHQLRRRQRLLLRRS